RDCQFDHDGIKKAVYELMGAKVFV
ncbi:MAG: hypothetical protein ACI81T_002616, partial [Bacteroidia bacterium]